MNKQNIALGIAVLALLFAGIAYITPGQPGQPGKDGRSGVGAAAGPDIPSPYLRFGASFGIREWKTATGLRAATTTPCAIQSPAATSTLISGGVTYTVASTSAVYTEIGKASTQYATTTSLGTAALAGGAQGTLLATTPVGGSFDESMVFGPSTWMVVKVSAGDVTNFAPTGACHATFEEYLPN